MKKSKSGKILTILSSVVLSKPPSYMSSYVTTKYALLGLINSIVSEYYKYNISFNCISPSMIETNFLSNVPEKIIELSKNQNSQKKNVDVKDLVREADSVMFCLSKGLSAPVGSLVCGHKEFIHKARKWRKMVGGGMRQSGHLAAAGIIALSDLVDQLKKDHFNAQKLAQGLARLKGIALKPELIKTNIIFSV